MKVVESLLVMIFGWTVPSVTFIAAIREAVPCRTYSNSRSSGRPRRAARVRRLRLRAWIAVFSSTLNSTASSGGVRYSAHTACAFLMNSGSGGRLSQPPVGFEVQRAQDPPDLRRRDPQRLVEMLGEQAVR